jgi:hypothetical protein
LRVYLASRLTFSFTVARNHASLRLVKSGELRCQSPRLSDGISHR